MLCLKITVRREVALEPEALKLPLLLLKLQHKQPVFKMQSLMVPLLVQTPVQLPPLKVILH
jgi:hypothetical protein